jgi:hypothetical protein
MTTFECKPCGGSYEADTAPAADAGNWTADDFGRLTDAQSEHIAAHPDSLKTQGGPDPARKRDWVGCRCKGTCRCPRRSGS